MGLLNFALSSAEQYVRQLVEHYLDHQQEFATHDEIGTRIDQLSRSQIQTVVQVG